jgi:hypothetical protein
VTTKSNIADQKTDVETWPDCKFRDNHLKHIRLLEMLCDQLLYLISLNIFVGNTSDYKIKHGR